MSDLKINKRVVHEEIVSVTLTLNRVEAVWFRDWLSKQELAEEYDGRGVALGIYRNLVDASL